MPQRGGYVQAEPDQDGTLTVVSENRILKENKVHQAIELFWDCAETYDKLKDFLQSAITVVVIRSKINRFHGKEKQGMDEYHLKTGKLGEKIVREYKKIEDKFTDTFLEEDGSLKTGQMAEKATSAYQKIEDAVVGGYKKIEDAAVGGYRKIENAFEDTFWEKDDQEQRDEASSAGEANSKPGKSPEDTE